MAYLSYKEKTSDSIIRIEYTWPVDISLIAGISYIISKWWMDACMSLVIDAIKWDLDEEQIMKTFNKYCIILPDSRSILDKDKLTVEDLLSNYNSNSY